MLRAEFEAGMTDPARERELLTEALGHLDLQLSLVRRRQAQLTRSGDDLEGRRRRVIELLGRAS